MQSCESTEAGRMVKMAAMSMGVNQMCCPLCEEPVRSVLFGLSAIGVVAIVRTVQKSVKRFTSRDARIEEPNVQAPVAAPADSTP
jgi:hypothetical protein